MTNSAKDEGSNIRFDAVPGGTRFRVRVQPRASATELAGAWQQALRVRLAAPPVDGEANDALIRFLARRLDVPRSAIRLVAGHTGRTKTVQVDGLVPAAVAARLI